MVKSTIDLVEFLRSNAPLLTSVVVLTIACVIFSKSIRKWAVVYYIAFAIPFALVAVPFLAELLGFEMSGFIRTPVLGEIVRDYIHMGTFGHPLLIIIMYMGALNAKNKNVKQLLSIRKELSILVGFPVLTHSLIRVSYSLPGAIHYFTDNADFMATKKVVSGLGAGISSFSFILGVVLLVLFLPLWVTSFDWVRKRMTYKKWKNLQKWAYVLYAVLFIHAMGIQVGGMLNPRRGHTEKPPVETVVKTPENQGNRDSNKHAPPKGFTDFKVSDQGKRYMHIGTLVLIYGSYLYFRLRKAKRSRKKRRSMTLA